MVDVCYL